MIHCEQMVIDPAEPTSQNAEQIVLDEEDRFPS